MTKTTVELNDNAKAIVLAIAAGVTSAKEVADKMGVSVATVNGNVTSLKKKEMVEVNEGVMKLTKAGKAYAKKNGAEAAPAKSATKAKPAGTAKKAKSVTTAKNPKATRKLREGTKAEAARAIFEHRGDKDRKTLIGELMGVGLSKAGAATYLQNCKRAAGLIGQPAH